MLLSGTANPGLAKGIADVLGEQLCDVTIKRFADGEIFARIDRNARGRDVFIVQSTNAPADTIMELLLLTDAARRASAARVTAVIPYFGYGRQDRKDQPRVAIGAKLVANLIVAAGADRVVSIDFHQHQIQGFFDIPVDHLYAAPVLTRYLRDLGHEDIVVVSPDVGAAKMARGYAKRIGASLAIIDKRRPVANQSEVLNVVGEVEGKTCFIVDDMVETGASVLELDYKCDLPAVKAATDGKATVLGVIDPSEVFARGTPESIAEAVREELEVLAPGGGLIVGPGCALPPETPAANMHAFVEAAERYGRYQPDGSLVS